MKKNQSVLILGANSLIGQALAEEFSKKNHDLILCLRKSDRLYSFSKNLESKYKNKVILLNFDILEVNYFEDFFKNLPIVPKVIISTIGIMNQPEKNAEYTIKNIINTNYVNQVVFFEIASKYLISKNTFSTIIIFGSVAGIRGRKKNYIYGSSKAGLHCYLSGLRQKYSKDNLNIITFIPGYMDTNMLETKTKANANNFLITKPDKVAKIIYKSFLYRRSIVYTPFWRYIILIINLIPESIFKKLSF